MSEPKNFARGFRLSAEDTSDMFDHLPLRNPTTWRERLAARWKDIKWRVDHAWDALIHGDCGYL